MIEARSGLRLFTIYAVLTLIPIIVLGFVLARSFKADLEHRGLVEGSTIARAISRGTIEPVLSGDPLADGPTATERAALHRAFESLLRRGDALKLRLRDAEGRIVFDPSQPNRPPFGPPDDEVEEAIAGEPVRLLTRLNADAVDSGESLGPQAIEVYMPVRRPVDESALGALEIYIPYEPIAASITSTYRHALTILVVGLLTLWSLLGAVTWSVTRRIRRSAAASEHLARTDALTGLANRMAMVEHVRERLDDGPATGVSVAVLDIDGFSAINETLGQENGDAFLQHVAGVITESIGEDDLVGRVGGDQFGIVFPTRDRAVTGPVIERVRWALLQEHSLGGVAITVEISVGTADGDRAVEASELIRRATAAVRAAKRARVPALDYRPDLEGFNADRLVLMTDLRHGIAEDQLVLHYQPKLAIGEDRVTGVEALVRWQHPTRGLLMPDTFVPAAESTELIVELTDWVVEAACAQAARWNEAGRPLPIAVNVSARCLRDAEFSDRVLAAVIRHRIPVELLTIEITETAVISDPARAAATLRRLAQRGIRIAIDDFGVGYTSLAHLDNLPLHELKIDRQFIIPFTASPDGGAVVRSVVSLGHGLGMTVVAEGVEDDATLAALTAIGCDIAQGYGIARPAPVAQFEAWLAARDRFDAAAQSPLNAPA